MLQQVSCILPCLVAEKIEDKWGGRDVILQFVRAFRAQILSKSIEAAVKRVVVYEKVYSTKDGTHVTV
ncbi:hypothetical protein CFP56_009186 [Quercus suber]|uniref:Uncharacterized protein n=1 Tax=Quercus suber TaxID=58331 RepID=A0AAW0L410_QUESU